MGDYHIFGMLLGLMICGVAIFIGLVYTFLLKHCKNKGCKGPYIVKIK